MSENETQAPEHESPETKAASFNIHDFTAFAKMQVGAAVRILELHIGHGVPNAPIMSSAIECLEFYLKLRPAKNES